MIYKVPNLGSYHWFTTKHKSDHFQIKQVNLKHREPVTFNHPTQIQRGQQILIWSIGDMQRNYIINAKGANNSVVYHSLTLFMCLLMNIFKTSYDLKSYMCICMENLKWLSGVLCIHPTAKSYWKYLFQLKFYVY